MKATRIIPFFYLVIAVLFTYVGIETIVNGQDGFWLYFLMAAVAVFMFFFRRKYTKRMEDYYNQKK